MRPLAAAFVPVELPADRAALVDFLSGDVWPYHGRRRHTPESAAEAADGHFAPSAETQPFWIEVADERAGLLVLQELEDLTPVFDLRLRAPFRGRGLGRAALAWLAERVFTVHGKHRVEGHTRVDNVPMRRVFRAAGWVKEAHYRLAWPDDEGRHHDAVAYALLARDWAEGTRTPVPFGEEP